MTLHAKTDAEREAEADALWDEACRDFDTRPALSVVPTGAALPIGGVRDDGSMNAHHTPSKCPECSGPMLDQTGEPICLACGWQEPMADRFPCQPFTWTDLANIPRREWLYGRHYIRRFVSATFSPGGVGKSSLALVEALAMASGKPLLGQRPAGQLRVAYWSGEDPSDENLRRVMAAAAHYGLTPDDIGDRLLLGSGRDRPIIIAEQTRTGVTINAPDVEAVTAMIRGHNLDALIIDPFVSSHRVTENDNNAIDQVVKQWAAIANAYNVSIDLVHHTRKGNGAETTVEDGRGASALLYAARSARALNGMTQEEAERAGVGNRFEYFRVDTGKANMAPRSDKANWHRMVSIDLGNGGDLPSDHVGVVTEWSWPDAFDGVTASDLRAVQTRISEGQWREDIRSPQWAGTSVAEVLGIDLDEKAGKQRVKSLLATWVKTGALKRVMVPDKTRQERSMIEVGTWAETA